MMPGRAPRRWRRWQSGCRQRRAGAGRPDAARGIDDAGWRAEALAAVAERLPAEEQPSVLGEALAAARGIDDAGSRAEALAAVASGCRQRRRWR